MTEFTMNPGLSIRFHEEPNADAAFVFGDTELPKQDSNIEDVTASCQWMGNVLIKAGMLHRWQSPELAHDRMHNAFHPVEHIMHSEYLDAFLLTPSITPPELAAPPLKGVDEEKLSREAHFIMGMGKQYIRLGEAVQGFAEVEGIERESIPWEYGHGRSKEVFTCTLTEPGRIFNIASSATLIKSVDLSFSTLHNEGREEDDLVVGNKIYIALHDEQGLHKQLAFGYGYSREKGRDEPPGPVHTPPESTPYPIGIWVNGHDTTYLKPGIPEYSDDTVNGATDRALKVLHVAKAIKERQNKKAASGSKDEGGKG